ncbi:pyridoxal phosphate-dependent aminotransferase [Streptomyces durbertensis]|uniref:Aminotransferase n=1 Tax=Streptomyces durbertensis TaxID=2448886 RepID=A0ABR6EFD7_9ACTN|nr:pyridoxal phosphate-dependent aminotransferase [Streptomyces durbertensis]MBB1244059.1 pyridoxal phosphate-dependent aminotransferase [Streptomyces durbertensis]
MSTSITTEPDSQVVGIYQRMTALAAEHSAVNLSQGIPEPVYDAEWRAALAAEVCLAHFQYTPSAGTPGLRESVASLYTDGLPAPVITSGCTESLAAVLLGLADEGCDTVLWLEPFYSYYPGLARLAGMDTRSVPIDLTGTAPRLDMDRLAEELAPLGRRGVLLLNSPHNPTGLVLRRHEWAAVCELVDLHGFHLVIDDVYRDFRYDGPAAPYAALMETGRTTVAGGVSKSYAAAGLRLGWLLTPDRLARRAETAHMHLSNCAPDLLQRAAVRLLAEVDSMRLTHTAQSYRRKRDHLLAALTDSGFTASVPDGGHFVMAVPPADRPWGPEPAVDLLRNTGVCALPLDHFFTRPDAPWLRFSFGVSAGQVEEAAQRLRRARTARNA